MRFPLFYIGECQDPIVCLSRTSPKMDVLHEISRMRTLLFALFAFALFSVSHTATRMATLIPRELENLTLSAAGIGFTDFTTDYRTACPKTSGTWITTKCHRSCILVILRLIGINTVRNPSGSTIVGSDGTYTVSSVTEIGKCILGLR